MSAHLKKRSLVLAGHDTSVALEREFWSVLELLAARSALPLAQIVTQVDARRAPEQSLASALRVHALEWLRAQIGEQATAPRPAGPDGSPAHAQNTGRKAEQTRTDTLA
ncbi:ribbon-helix-helix domain-containing protein [Acetobacter sp. TBRC 12305]|uniref:Ribbon-helix-helix domain-containing protein n=1 Tax=Acetobacter garciniae TaxID=2817435 RepID=A0A939HI81_9PROT|nr:ribbon-helix-helix domain-containing protein [Acetobacter garciniae]MBX0344566.1 ribbon-helix-helix domain-containing protein [Acetobacter garciniae]